jgi:nicotinamidase-related amidase
MSSFDLTLDNSLLLLVDMQEKFLPAIPGIAVDQPCGKNCRNLLITMSLLGVPAVITEQYPQGLGPTFPSLIEANPQARRFEKMHFSCSDDPEISNHIVHANRDHIIICGIEAHVCVLSTVSDLMHRGLYVTVVSDAVASRREESKTAALEAARDLGALVVPTESVIFRLQRRAGVGCFKALSQLVK